jgi:hypothetical protein
VLSNIALIPGTVVKTRFSKRLPQSDALFIMIDLLASSISCSLIEGGTGTCIIDIDERVDAPYDEFACDKDVLIISLEFNGVLTWEILQWDPSREA